MKVAKKREYRSLVRQRHADETRAKVVSAARKLLEEQGYAGMTIEAVAANAEVAVPTVYSIFGSKTGILSAILDQARFGGRFRELVCEAMRTPDPVGRLKFAARIARRVYESESSIIDLMRGAGAVAPSLAQAEVQRDCQRYDAQKGMIRYLVERKRLRAELVPSKARDILWLLTGRDLYRMLVRDRKWTPQEYENWLQNALAEQLIEPETAGRAYSRARRSPKN